MKDTFGLRERAMLYSADQMLNELQTKLDMDSVMFIMYRIRELEIADVFRVLQLTLEELKERYEQEIEIGF